MKHNILSLRSIYKLLTANDYPIYSNPVISKGKRRGLTLTQFWHDYLIAEFTSGSVGQRVWKQGEGRNRYLSEICNRSKEFAYYSEYFAEIQKEFTADHALNQIKAFMTFLNDKQFSFRELDRRVFSMIAMLREDDASFSDEALDFFEQNMRQREYFDGIGEMGRLFYSGWMLLFMTLHALAGNGENENALKLIRLDDAYGIRNLYKLACEGNTLSDDINAINTYDALDNVNSLDDVAIGTLEDLAAAYRKLGENEKADLLSVILKNMK